jgi:hypothetical protein
MMSDIQPTHQELESQLRERVADAKVRLDLTRNYLKEVQRDLKSGMLPPSDGRYAHHRALQAETLALDHYQHVLKTLSGLVVDGKIPDEQEPP